MDNASRSILWSLTVVMSLAASPSARQTSWILERTFPRDDTPFSVRTPKTVNEYAATVLEIGRRLGVPIGLETRESQRTESPDTTSFRPWLSLAGLNAVQAIRLVNTQFAEYDVRASDSIVLVRPQGAVSFLDDVVPEWSLENGTLEDALAALEAAIAGTDAPLPAPPGTHRAALIGDPVFFNSPSDRGSLAHVDLSEVYDFSVERGATFRTTLTRLAAAIGGGSWRVRHMTAADGSATADITLYLKSGAGITGRRLVLKH
jgi:hypothetical protein